MGVIYAVFSLVMASAQRPTVALVAIFVILLFGGISAIAAAVPLTTPNQFCGQVSSVYLLVTYLVGTGLGPTMVALFTDKYFHNDAMVGWSIATALCIFGPLSTILLLTAREPMLHAIDTPPNGAFCPRRLRPHAKRPGDRPARRDDQRPSRHARNRHQACLPRNRSWRRR